MQIDKQTERERERERLADRQGGKEPERDTEQISCSGCRVLKEQLKERETQVFTIYKHSGSREQFIAEILLSGYSRYYKDRFNRKKDSTIGLCPNG